MTINRIPGSPLNQTQGAEQYQQMQKKSTSGSSAHGSADLAGDMSVTRTDHAAISDQAHSQLAMHRLLEEGRLAAAQAPDVRSSKLAEVRQRLADGFYQSAAVRDQVADRLGRIFLEQDLF